jgi:succinate dehydrogenase/fumarate reductase flavoprotein subunit
MTEASWDHVVDVVIVGSGAGAMAAAITAARSGSEVEVIEKAELLGGTSAWSGGMPWMPRNHHMAEVSVDDSREDALTYLESLSADRYQDQELIERYVDQAGEAMKFLEDNSALEMVVAGSYSDYYADRPGGKPRGRSLEPKPLDARTSLGDWEKKVRDSPHIPPLTQDEMAVEGSRRNLPLQDGEVPQDVVALITERTAKGIRCLGAALISGLLRGALNAGVTFRTSTPADRLVLQNGQVVGVVAHHDGDELRIGARRGVVLASGGFEWNEEFVKTFLGVPDLFPLSPPTNVGDGLRMGMEAGAALGNMSNGIAFPSIYDGRAMLEGKPHGSLAGPRNDPGVIIVNRHGKRFANEGICYMDLAKLHKVYDEKTATYPNTGPVWQIFDQTVRDRTIALDFMPNQPTPDWVHEAATIAELAEKIGVDPGVLTDQVERWNSYVDAGEDPDFHRGTIWWEGFQIEGPSPEKNMRRIETGPFYAMALYNGILGTVGGLRIDTDARVQGLRGGPIEGLYAVGNVASGIFGQTYPGGGGTLGPGLTFGYLAGQHVAAQSPREIEQREAVAQA